MSMEAQQEVTNLFKGSSRRKCTHAILKVILTQFTAFRESSDKWTVILSSVLTKLKIYGWLNDDRYHSYPVRRTLKTSTQIDGLCPEQRRSRKQFYEPKFDFQSHLDSDVIFCHLFVAEAVPLCEAQLLLSLNKQLHGCDHQCWQACCDSSSLCSVVIGPSLRICPLQDLASLSGPESNSIQWGLEKVWE